MSVEASSFTIGVLLFAIGVVGPMILARVGDASSTELRPWMAPPSIEVVVPAYLEVGEIRQKVRDLQRDLGRYPGRGIITVMASDSDTANAARSAGADRVVECGRGGKADAMNQAAVASTCDVVVFTDANCEIRPIDWPAIAAEGLESAGMVSSAKAEAGGSDGLYWLLERATRGKGDVRRSTLAVVGEFMAVRRELYSPLDPRTLLDDFLLAWTVVEAGSTVVVDSRITTVEPATPAKEQWGRRVRIAQGVLSTMGPRVPVLLRDRLGRRALMHKLYRMTIGAFGFWLAAAVVIIASPTLIGMGVAAVLICSVVSYIGWARIPGPAGSLAAVVGMQAVPVAAWGKLAVGRRSGNSVGWDKVAR